MTEKKISVRLAVEDDDKVKQSLVQLGREGQEALRKFELAGAPASRGLRAVDAAASDLRQTVQGLASRLGPIGSALGALGPGGMAAAAGLAAATLGVTSLFRAARDSIAYAADIGDSAERIGIAAEALQELRYAATQRGMDGPSIDQALSQLNRRVGETIAGAGQAKAIFETLGVTLVDVQGRARPLADIFRDTAERLSQVRDPAQQAAAATRLFGAEIGGKMLPLLQGGAAGLDDLARAARDAGAVIGAETIEKAAEADAALQQLALTMKAGLAEALVDLGPQLIEIARLMGKVLPPAVAMAADALEWVARNADLVVIALGALVGLNLGAKLGPWGAAIGAVVGALAGFATATGAAEAAAAALADRHPEVTGFLAAVEAGGIEAAAGLDQMSRAAQRAVVELARLKALEVRAQLEPLMDLQSALRQERQQYGLVDRELIYQGTTELIRLRQEFERGAISAEALDAGIAGVKAQLDRIDDRAVGLAVELARTESGTGPLRARIDEWFQVEEAARAALEAELRPAGQAIDLAGALAGGGRNSVAGAARQATEALAQYIEHLRFEAEMSGLSTEEAERRRALLQGEAAARLDYNNELRDSAELTAQERIAILAAVDARQANIAALRENAEAEKMVQQATGAMRSFLEELIRGSKSATDAVLSLTEALIQMAAQALIMGPLQQALTGFANSIFGVSLNATGNVYEHGHKLHAYARGGVVAGPQLFPMADGLGLMGEAGPEAIMPLSRTRDGRLGVIARAGGEPAAPQTIVNIVDRRSAEGSQPVQTRETVGPNGQRQLEIMIADAVRREVRGGGLDRALGDSFGMSRRGRR